jgi:hydroxymethylpyrimidine/phosphomethylpyrimidine kinase
VLAIAGSDSGGGAGIQADIKTVMALGAYAMTAVTALTAQNTHGVKAIYPVPAAFVIDQMVCVLEDIGADAIKTGMLGDAAVITAVCDTLMAHARGVPMVVDPVMVAKGGAALLANDALGALRDRLFPLASIVTPNLPEAEVLTGLAIENVDDMRRGADTLLRWGLPAVLLKGGHLRDDIVTDVFATPFGCELLQAPRIRSRHTHGTGCTLASAIATGLAQGMTLSESVVRARDYVRAAISAAPGFGSGHGPLNHNV